METPATDYLKLAGYISAPVGAFLGGGVPGLIGHSIGAGDAPEQNRGFWRPALYGTAGGAAGLGLGYLGAAGAGELMGLSPSDVMESFGPATILGAGALGSGVGGYLAGKQQNELPR